MKPNAPLFSVVIPTCDRANLFEHCLRTVTAQDYPDLEIVVQDNASRDNTKDIVLNNGDSRILYNRLDNRVSMRANFEAGLNKSRGRYLIFIGDDDGLALGCLNVLAKIIAERSWEMINWPAAKYFWPSLSKTGSGYIMLRYGKCFGGVKELNVETGRENCFNGRGLKPRELGFVYHGCISAELIARVKQRQGGHYFLHAIPDYYSAFANVLEARSALSIRHPLSIAGRSAQSNGAAFAQNQKTPKDLYQKFLAENALDKVKLSFFDATIRSVEYINYKCLLEACRLRKEDGRIEHKIWQIAVKKDCARQPQELRRVLFAKLKQDPDFLDVMFDDPESSAMNPPFKVNQKMHSFDLSRFVYDGKAGELENVMKAAMVMADRLKLSIWPQSFSTSNMVHVFRWIVLKSRAFF